MKKLVVLAFAVLLGWSTGSAWAEQPLKVGIVGLEHGHVAGFLGGGALVPAGAIQIGRASCRERV